MECNIKSYLSELSIAKKFFIVSVVMLLLILLIFNIVIFQNFKKVFINREKNLFKQWIEATVKGHLNFFVYKKAWNKDMDFIPLVNEIKKFPDIINITFYSPKGEILYILNRKHEKNKCIFKNALSIAKKGDFLGDFFTLKDETGKKQIIQAFFYPFIFKKRLNGIIQVCKNPENLLKQINYLRLIVLMISFAGFLMYIFIVYFIITKIETREKRLQEEIVQYQRLSCLGHFSAKMSHELGTPIHVIQGNVELIGELIKDDFVEERTEVINRQIRKINNIIKNYLYLAKEPVPEYDFFYLDDFISQIIDNFSFTIPENIKILKDIEDCNVFSDKNFIEQILYNFIKNASDSIGEKNGIIEIKSFSDNTWIYIEVRDNGRGFSKEMKKNLFEPFFTTKKTGKGTGLGLSVCKDLIESLNGEIYCDSNKKETVFGIKIPKKDG